MLNIYEQMITAVTNFIPYADLTYDIVSGWLDNSIDVTALDLNLDQQIENQVNPPIVVLPLPLLIHNK